MSLQLQKDKFSLDESAHYLNCAYMSPLLKKAEEVANLEMVRRRNPQMIRVDDFFMPLVDLKALFSGLIGEAETNRIAIIPSVSYGLANAAMNVRPKTNGNVVITEGQFPSNYYIWKRICDDLDMELRIVPKPDGVGNWSGAIIDQISRETVAVAMPHVHWADGSMFNLVEIGKRCRECEAFFIIDGTQSVGALPFDNPEIRADAVICAGYKWLLGPYGIGMAFYNKKFDDGEPIEESWFSRENSNEFAELVNYNSKYREGAWRYSVGESSNFIYVQMLMAGLSQIDIWQPSRIQDYIRELVTPAIGKLLDLGCLIDPPEFRSSHLFGVIPPKGTDMEELLMKMRSRKVFVSQRGKYIRVAPHVYNTTEDMDALVACIADPD